MGPRAYNSVVRKEAEVETLRRIVDATIELHREKGVMATTHAEIAQLAGVSVPTVYKHFPTRNALLPACIGKVGKGAPVLDPASILAVADMDRRLAHMVMAIHAQYAYFHPWLRWAPVDAPFLPELSASLAQEQAQRTALLKAALGNMFADQVPPDLLALAQVMVDYDTWRRLTELLGEQEAASNAAASVLQRLVSSYLERE